MKWTPADPDLTTWLTAKMEPLESAQYKPMFGFPTWFVNGHMFSSVHGDVIMLRLAAVDQGAMQAEISGVEPFVAQNGRPMKDYVQFPAFVVEGDADLDTWIETGYSHTASLAPKAPRPRKSAAKKAATTETDDV